MSRPGSAPSSRWIHTFSPAPVPSGRCATAGGPARARSGGGWAGLRGALCAVPGGGGGLPGEGREGRAAPWARPAAAAAPAPGPPSPRRQRGRGAASAVAAAAAAVAGRPARVFMSGRGVSWQHGGLPDQRRHRLRARGWAHCAAAVRQRRRPHLQVSAGGLGPTWVRALTRRDPPPDSRPRPCTCTAPPLVTPASPARFERLGRGAGGGGLGKGRKAARAESRRTWHSDIAALGAMPRFWLDPGPACPLPPLMGILAAWRGLGACGNARCGGNGDFPDLGPRHPLNSQRHHEGRGGPGAQLRQLLGCCPQEMPSWAVGMALFFHRPVQSSFHLCPWLPTS